MRNSRTWKSLGPVTVLLGLPFISGCSSVGYLWQASRGQLKLFNRTRPLGDVLNDERVEPRIKGLLREVPVIKSFGEKSGLRPTTNYTEFVNWDGPAVVWVVSACARYSFTAKTWSFPVVGSFNYLGWFGKSDALRHATELEAQGWDVDVRGASAYSTLGWFRDPIVSTMLTRAGADGVDSAAGDLANVVLHESVHASFYVEGQSTFNESLASFVADRLTPVFLSQRYGGDSKELKDYLTSEKQSEARLRLLNEAYHRLDERYRRGGSESELRDFKNRELDDLQKRLGFPRKITNATLVQHRTYQSGMREFEELYLACGKEPKRFFSALEALRTAKKETGSAGFPRPQLEDLGSVLKPLVLRGCPPLPNGAPDRKN